MDSEIHPKAGSASILRHKKHYYKREKMPGEGYNR